MLRYFCNKKLPKVNNRALSENSPNLVTLLTAYLREYLPQSFHLIRVTRCVCNKVVQNAAQSIFVIISTYTPVTVEKRSQIFGATYVIFTKTTQSSQWSPGGVN
jgi:hypothetical protein